MTPKIALRNALADKKLLGAELAGESWANWRILLIAIMGEPLTPLELETFRKLTQRQNPPANRVDEFFAVIGRRGGKSKAIAALAVYLATMCSWSGKLSRGETGMILIIAADQRQARVILEYAAATLEASPILAQSIMRKTADVIELQGNISIEVRSAAFRRLRGMTCLAVIGDEVAYWMDDTTSSNPDTEILAAARPTLATTGGPLICISSPYARRGVLWQAYREHFGKDDDGVFVAQAASREMNPLLSQAIVDRALEQDAAKNSAEYLAQFRSDIEGFLSQEAIEQCIIAGILERPYEPRHRYVGFVDPSGGSGDSFTMAIAHKEGETSVLDLVRERKSPCEPPNVVEEFAHTLRRYHVNTVEGDHYAGEWPASIFRQHEITYEPSEQNKSEIYRDALPLLTGRKALLLDEKTLKRQLASLERRTSRGGRDSIDHAPGAKDDVANAVAGALTLAQKNNTGLVAYDDDCDIPYPANWDKQFA